MPASVQTPLYHRDPLGVLRRVRARHGSVFTLRFSLKGPIVFVAEPGEVRPLLERDPGSARAGRGRRMILPMASPRSVFGADDEAHRVAHRRIAPAFASEALAPHHAVIAELAERHVLAWPRRRPFRLLPRVRELIDDAFVRLILGVRSEPGRAELARAIGRMLWTPGNPPLPIPGQGDGLPGAIGKAVFERMQAPVARLIGEEVEARRRSAEGSEGDDVIGALLRAEPALAWDAIADELIAILAAAQEPPSIAVTWILDRLARSPDARERYLAGRSGDPARDAVVRETLRLRPPAQAALRTLSEPATIAGHALPAGTLVAASIPLLGRDGRAFPEPDRFRPERWLSGPVDESGFIPFGWGARRCLGEHLARVYFDAVVPAVARRLTIRSLSREPERMVVRATTLVPRRGLLVRTD